MVLEFKIAITPPSSRLSKQVESLDYLKVFTNLIYTFDVPVVVDVENYDKLKQMHWSATWQMYPCDQNFTEAKLYFGEKPTADQTSVQKMVSQIFHSTECMKKVLSAQDTLRYRWKVMASARGDRRQRGNGRTVSQVSLCRMRSRGLQSSLPVRHRKRMCAWSKKECMTQYLKTLQTSENTLLMYAFRRAWLQIRQYLENDSYAFRRAWLQIRQYLENDTCAFRWGQSDFKSAHVAGHDFKLDSVCKLFV